MAFHTTGKEYEANGRMMKSLLHALRAGHWPSLLGAWLHFEVSFMIWLLVGALGVFIAEDFGLTASQKGLLVAVPLLGGAVLRILVGTCSDRFGAKPTGLVLLVGETIVLIWGWVGATSYVQILGVGLLLGIAGASFAVALPLASQAYPPAHQGFAMGVAAAGNSGVVLAAFLAPRLGEIVGWHGVFGLMAIPVVLTALVFATVVKDGGHTPSHPRSWWGILTDGLRQRTLYWLCMLYAVSFGGFVGLSSFLPIFFHDEYGLTPVMAGSITALCGLAGSVIRPLGGYVADRRGGLLVLRYLLPVIGVLSLSAGRLPQFEVATPLLIALMTALGFGNGVVFQVVSSRFREQMGMASGVIGAAGGLGGFMLPSLLGLLKDLTGSYGAGLLLFAILVFLAWSTVELAVRRQRLEVNQVM